ncbi:tRNA (adenosine(37)-N6)-dimethylallyltransferase MiaA [Ruminococcus sp. JL13D9]|uniref:tRNA (adenosine(37)-N6)-dimethylallyltransferase MiaA n=1 Tax=Ruminococcus sp. JL13D9 TaxID=3233381 RepID=UPI00389B322D
MNNKIKLITVVGPTASGKTRLGVELAKRYGGEVISADSMQIYKGMQIATAKPTVEEMQGIPHHLMDFLEPNQTYSVAMFVDDAKKCIEDISSRGKIPVIVGGTGLYVDSLLNNISFHESQRDTELSEKLRELYYTEGVDYLLDMLRKFDGESAERLETEKNPKRIIRAIEFYKTTGITITEQNKNSKNEESPYSAIKLGLNFEDRQKLYDRINKRVDLMVEAGLILEAKRVFNSELSFTSVKAIGYKELFPYLKGELPLEECIEKLKQETRRYAKRQITWFKRDKEINWLYPDKADSLEQLFEQAVQITDKGLTYG